ncbi:CocE/NonD family hydrolase [Novosphingobium sp. PP1Y]|uniref:CocE/NonD family hydrolase n=1 Tax=Novosphingobium sp. PP1Y TaxID=702113 RepID=UPI0002F955E9|nr:CocE/NonD family hydrolase [Novosphingobium sp. PP1Y]
MAGIRAMTGEFRVGRAHRLWRRTTVFLSALAAGSLVVASGVRAEDYPDYTRSSFYVPVRDGTKLAMNVYRPANADGVTDEKLPVIFAFTPYRARYKDKDGKIVEAALGDQLALRSLLRAGYVVAVADIRGKGASFGHRRGFQDRTEARDGYDLVEWLAHQPFSSGKVGMIGCSYLGGTTMHTVSTAPPSLKAAFIGATDWDKYAFVRRGGLTAQFNTRPDEPPTVDLASVPVDADPDGAMLRKAVAEHAANTSMGGLWYSMPYRDSVSPLTGNDFWNEVAIWRYADAIRKSGIATYMWGNWKDEPTSQVLVAAKNLGSRLLVGPGSHCVPPPGFDFTGEITRYFDYYLKGADNGFSAQPPVTFWSADGNAEGHYVRQDALPGAGSTTWSWYLNGGDMDGARALSSRPGESGTDRFTVDYDVANDAYFAFWPEPLDAHGITYTSAPLEHPVDLLGYPLAHLQLQSDRPDADVFVYLEEVSPGGAAQVLSFGRLKLSHRAIAPAPWDNLGLPWHSGLRKDVSPLGKGETARMEIAMMPLSHRIEPGYRLRFVMTGADPRQRNLAEVRQDPPPVLEIERGWQSGSRIDLPLREPHDAAISGQIGGPGGRGTYPAVAQARADAPGYTIYRPQVLPEGKLPLVLWGNGGCRDDGLSAGHALKEFASHGYLVIANGAPRQERPVLAALPQPGEGPMRMPTEAERKADETSAAQMLDAIDWAERVNADPADPLYGHIDTTRIAATGHSCGGLQALAAGADPRVDTVIAFGSGVYNRTGSGLSGVKIVKDDLKRLHTPVAYILGGPTDIAYPNGTDDFARIAHVPVMLANLPVGHGGTLALADGGEWARVGATWLNWQLKGDRQAGLMFTGQDCGLCKTPGWTVKRKQFPAKP